MSRVSRGFVSGACRLAPLVACVHGLVAADPVTYYDDVLPLLRKNCVSCHASGGSGKMPLATYDEVRPHAEAIGNAVRARRMPPWFADAASGEFANDPRLSEEEIRVIDAWGSASAPAGKPPSPARQRRRGRAAPVVAAAPVNTGEVSADLVIAAPRPVAVPAGQTLTTQSLIFPLPFTYDRWVRAAQIRPKEQGLLHHAVLYVREPRSKEAGAGDILAVYTAGSPWTVCPEGTAKKIAAGSDLVLQLFYAGRQEAASDQPEIGLAFAGETPKKRALTLRLDAEEQPGRTPVNAVLVGMLPLAHRREGLFDVEVVEPNGRAEAVLKVKPSGFDWHSKYVLRTPRPIAEGAGLRWSGNGAAGEAVFFDLIVDLGVEWRAFSW